MGGPNSLNDGESQIVYSSAGGQVKSTAVVRLYMSQGNTWAYSNLWGAAALVADGGENGPHYIRLVNLQSGQVTWEQELYDRFEYHSATPFFHTFEGNDSVIGLSFADDVDASSFQSAIGCVPFAARGGPPAPTRRPTQPTPTPARSPPSTPPAGVAPAPVATAPPALQRAPSSAANLTQGGGGGGSVIMGQSAFAGTAGSGSKRLQNPKKKKGWFSRITEKIGLGEDEGNQDIILSGPTGFRHESHIGWDPANGFEIRNIPPEWRKLFQAAGVKKSELRDANTAKFIMDTVAEATMGANPMAAPMGGPPPVPTGGAPPRPSAPPPPPGGGGGHHHAGGGGGPPPPPAPPGPPPPPSPSAPSAPPPPSFGGPSAPPPPPPAASMSFGSSLADQLSSAQLKSVEDRALPDLNNMNEEQSSTLADTLAKAMAARRVDMRADDELDSDDEWSD